MGFEGEESEVIYGHQLLIELTGCESLPEEVLAASFAFSGCHGRV